MTDDVLEVCLRAKPEGRLSEGDFVVVTRPPVESAPGEVVTRTTWLSMDPYLTMRMYKEIPEQPFGPPFPIVARTVGVVVDPGDSQFAPGEVVLGFGRWATSDSRPAADLRKIETDRVPVSAHLGSLGHSGVTAWLGLHLGGVSAGQTVVVSGASGAVGSVAGQLAKRAGARVIGIAGGAAKVARVTGPLGFDGCADHQRPDLEGQLAELAPEGADLHFENVGVRTLDPVLTVMKRGGRVMLCGLVQHYQSHEPVQFRNFRRFLESSISLQPFSIYEHEELHVQARAELAEAVRAGDLRITETVGEGIENVPAEFVSMLASRGMGKHVVRIG